MSAKAEAHLVKMLEFPDDYSAGAVYTEIARALSTARSELAALRSSLEPRAAVEPRRELAMGAGVRGQSLGMACYTDATLAPDEMKLYQDGRIVLRVTGLRVEAAAPVAVSLEPNEQ